MNGADIKNVFNGNTLEQNVVTRGINGIPRRSIRVITNYDINGQNNENVEKRVVRLSFLMKGGCYLPSINLFEDIYTLTYRCE